MEKNSTFEQFGELLTFTRYDTIQAIELSLDILMANYDKALTTQNIRYKELVEINLSWIIRLICELVTTYIRNISAMKSYDRKEIIICAKIIKLVIITDKLNKINKHLESSLLAFMTSFRKYLCSISDTLNDDISVVGRDDLAVINSIVGVNSFLEILDIFMNRIIRDLGLWGNCNMMLREISSTLDGFTIGASMITLMKGSKTCLLYTSPSPRDS